MNIALRIVLYLLLAGALLFCVSGFMATFEPIEPGTRIAFRLIYGLGAGLAAAGLAVLKQPRRPRG